ncbi:NTF2-like protein [Trametes sanguinea]|nr:NTF2-like protein [Trametes sanguinea]
MTNNTSVNPSEVGWQFVPQYYTFVNKHPNRLHCFYNKSSTFIHGTEGEDGKPCFGQQEIHNKITSIGFQDCKVFIHSVDAQSSANGGIIIQVIGEMSNKGEAWRKFVQTFFLAEQPNGYFVLNDIFRFLKEESVDEGDEQDQPEAASQQKPAPAEQHVPASPAPPSPAPPPFAEPEPTWASLAAKGASGWGPAVATQSRGTSEAPAPHASASPAPLSGPQSPAPHVTTRPLARQEPHPAFVAAQNIQTPQCFVKGVTENVTEAALRTTLTARFGPIKDLEIVRNKACAFIEFQALESAKRAIIASLPHAQGGEGGIRIETDGGAGQARITVETRKERGDRPGQRGGAPMNGDRGRGAFRGRGGPGRGRGGPPPKQ